MLCPELGLGLGSERSPEAQGSLRAVFCSLPSREPMSDVQFALILRLDTQSEEQTLPFPVPLERSQLRRMSPFSSTLNLQPSFSGRSYFELRSSAHQLSLHSSLQSLNSAGELSASGLASWSVLLGISKLSVCSVLSCLFLP